MLTGSNIMDASNWKLDPSTNMIFTSIFLCGCDQWLDLYTNIFTLHGHGIFFHTCVEVLLGDVEFPLILDNSFNLFPESLFNFMTKAGTMSSNFSNILLLEFSFPSVRSSVRPHFDMHHTCMHHRYMLLASYISAYCIQLLESPYPLVRWFVGDKISAAS